ncbi:MAG: SGNH/GDSL hydrolase family protein [Nitrospirales bacterium]
MKGKSKKIAIIVIVFIVSGFAFLFIAECSLRILGISYPVFHGFDPLRGRVLVPGKEGWFHGEGNAYVKINSAGFRDVEHSLQKPHDTYRILILGDSYTEARQVALEDTFGRKIEHRLQSCERVLPNEKVEVINFGVPGYGNAEQLIALRTLGWAYAPDLVMTVFFSGNDLLDNFPQANPLHNEFIPRPYLSLDQGKLNLSYNFNTWSPALLKYRFLLWGVEHFRTLEVLNRGKQVISAWKFGKNRDNAFHESGLSEFVYAPPQTSIHQEAWSLTEAILTLTRKEVLEHDAEFFLVTATSPNQIDSEQQALVKSRLGVKTLDYPEKRLRKMAESMGFPILNLLYEFQRYTEEHGEYLHGFSNTKLGAGHWNEKGHDLAANLMSEKICRDVMPQQ